MLLVNNHTVLDRLAHDGASRSGLPGQRDSSTTQCGNINPGVVRQLRVWLVRLGSCGRVNLEVAVLFGGDYFQLVQARRGASGDERLNIISFVGKEFGPLVGRDLLFLLL